MHTVSTQYLEKRVFSSIVSVIFHNSSLNTISGEFAWGFFLQGTCMLTRYTQGIRSFQMRSVDICSELTIQVLTANREVQTQVVWTWPWLPHGPEMWPKMVFRTKCQGNDSGTGLTVAVPAVYVCVYIYTCRLPLQEETDI